MLSVRAEVAAKYYNISTQSLRRWAREGLIPTVQTKGNQYRYLVPSQTNESTNEPRNNGHYFIYARVSSKKQEKDLQRQIQYLQERFPDYTVVSDIGSGLNYKREGFKRILETLFRGKVRHVVVAHQDRFSRFGFDFFQWLFDQFGGKLESLERSSKSREEELIGDIMEVFTVFSARYYGNRNYAKDKENPDLSESDTESPV